MEYFFEVSHANWRKVLGFSFLKGVATGLGVFMGGTIVVAILLWFLSVLGHVPFIDRITNPAINSFEQSQTQ